MPLLLLIAGVIVWTFGAVLALALSRVAGKEAPAPPMPALSRDDAA
jgi:hypothetical protein